MSERDDRRVSLWGALPWLRNNRPEMADDVLAELEASERDREELATYRELSKLVESYADEACELRVRLWEMTERMVRAEGINDDWKDWGNAIIDRRGK